MKQVRLAGDQCLNYQVRDFELEQVYIDTIIGQTFVYRV